MKLIYIECEGVNWIHLTQEKGQWALVKTVMNAGVQ